MKPQVIVLAGGSGSRLWPLSRARRPKFLVDIGNGETLLESTIRRALRITSPERIMVVTGRDHADETRQLAAQLAVTRIVVEPEPRDTANALTLANLLLAREDPDALVISMPADHVIPTSDGWLETIEAALEAAAAGALVAVACAPTRPETGYGYLLAPALPGQDPAGARPVLEFLEKPDEARAREYVASGDRYWNTAIMSWQLPTFFSCASIHMPDIVKTVSAALGISTLADDRGDALLDEDLWSGARKVAVDYALLQGAASTGNLVMVPATFGWADVGDWATLSTVMAEHDSSSHLLAHDSPGSFVTRPPDLAGKRYVIAGLPDCVVVDQGDVTLILHKSVAQDLKGVLQGFDGRGWADLL